MKQKEFVSKLDQELISKGISQAEEKSSGEIRVYVTRRKSENVMATAQEEFHRLGMEKTKYRNGVLLFIMPVNRSFAIVGDEGIHQKCGDVFWQETRDAMVVLLKEERFTDAILAGVNRAGEVLARYFPRDADDKNELPNEVVTD